MPWYARCLLTLRAWQPGYPTFNKEDMQEYQVNAAMIILGASAGESARLLLNSKSQQHPGGLANSSGVVGKYLH